MDKLEKNSIQFDYFSSNYKKFEDDFYKFADFNIPLTFIADDILKLMVSTNKNYFRLNGGNSKDGLDHYFIFREHPHNENKSVKMYEYVGHRYSIKNNRDNI